MPETKEKEDPVVIVVCFIVWLIQIPVALLWQAFVVIKIWDWLIIQYIPFQISYQLAIAVDLLLGISLIKPIPPQDLTAIERLSFGLTSNFIIPLYGLLIAYIVFILK